MLERLLDAAPFIAVFFHDDDCAECEAILESLEQVAAERLRHLLHLFDITFVAHFQIDDEADVYGIDFVKISDSAVAKEHGVYSTPALVYFRKKMPVA